jgi:hypothetical protein
MSRKGINQGLAEIVIDEMLRIGSIRHMALEGAWGKERHAHLW